MHATKAAILDELMGELEGRFATKTQLQTELSKAKAAHALRPTASEFVPLQHSAGGSPEAPATGGRAASHLQKPPPFDGRSPWDAYKLQFQMLAVASNPGSLS